jgi:hypothetical protein
MAHINPQIIHVFYPVLKVTKAYMYWQHQSRLWAWNQKCLALKWKIFIFQPILEFKKHLQKQMQLSCLLFSDRTICEIIHFFQFSQEGCLTLICPADWGMNWIFLRGEETLWSWLTWQMISCTLVIFWLIGHFPNGNLCGFHPTDSTCILTFYMYTNIVSLVNDEQFDPLDSLSGIEVLAMQALSP